MDNSLKAKIVFEISQIDKLLNDSKSLLDLCKLQIPDFIEMSAAALVLHSFYNGIENILVLIFKYSGEQLPKSNKWHMELLDKAFISEETRKQIFNNEIQQTLEEYLKFRHFIRHAYGFQLEWERMAELINGMEDFWIIVKADINNFIETN
ncbi:MAG: hypothetical protein LBK13_08760 [Spirochaetales bacterium]|nr:hypothetical protein [Spirochaetales bacterium]